MKTYNYIIFVILIIGIIIVTRELTIRTFQCPKYSESIYTNINQDLNLEQEQTINNTFNSMFQDASPWIGVQQTEYIHKKEINFTEMD